MDKLVYIYYPLLLVLLFAGAKVYGRKEWNEESFSLSQMKAVQGFCAVCIMCHHIAQKTCASWIPKYAIVPSLSLFVPIGYFFVGIFLFCSGYGLLKSFREKDNYLKGFFRRRVVPLVVGYYLSNLIFLAARLLVGGEKMTPFKWFSYLSGIMLSNTYAWFVIALPIFYTGFYFAFKFCKSENTAIFTTALVVFVYTLIGTIVDHNNFWMRGEWWYNSVHMFTVGILFAANEEKLIAGMKKHWVRKMIVSLVMLLVFYVFSEVAQRTLSYYGEDWNAPFKVGRRWGCLLMQMGASYMFAAAVFLLGMKVKLGNKVLQFMGKITLEFYLIHGLFVELFVYTFLDAGHPVYYIKNPFIVVIVVVVLSVPAALLFKKLMETVLKLIDLITVRK